MIQPTRGESLISAFLVIICLNPLCLLIEHWNVFFLWERKLFKLTIAYNWHSNSYDPYIVKLCSCFFCFIYNYLTRTIFFSPSTCCYFVKNVQLYTLPLYTTLFFDIILYFTFKRSKCFLTLVDFIYQGIQRNVYFTFQLFILRSTRSKLHFY